MARIIQFDRMFRVIAKTEKSAHWNFFKIMSTTYISVCVILCTDSGQGNRAIEGLSQGRGTGAGQGSLTSRQHCTKTSIPWFGSHILLISSFALKMAIKTYGKLNTVSCSYTGRGCGLRFRVRYIRNPIYPNNPGLYKTYCELFLRD